MSAYVWVLEKDRKVIFISERTPFLISSWGAQSPSKTLEPPLATGWWADMQRPSRSSTPLLCALPLPQGQSFPLPKHFFSTRGISQTCLPPVWKLSCVQPWWRRGRWCPPGAGEAAWCASPTPAAARLLPVLPFPPPHMRGLAEGVDTHGGFEKDLVFTPSSTTDTLVL